MIKAIALDLDGTLLTDDKKISETNKKILKELEKKGIKVILVTGRTYVSAKPYAQELGIGNILIAYNGAKVVNYKNDKILFEMPLHANFVKEVIKIAKNKNIHVNLYKDNKWYIENNDSRETRVYSKNTGLTPLVKDFSTFDDYVMTKVTLFNLDNSKEFNEVCDEIREKFLGKVHTTKSHEHLFEIMNRNVNKGIVLKDILKLEGISMQDCVAFGDAFNDLEMLMEAGYGVAMGNAPLDLKRRVRYVTDTNENNGVAKFLKKYFY